jgi:hypothetical protein
LKKLLLASKNSEIPKFRKFGNIFLMPEFFFFFAKNKNFHRNLPEAGRLKEFDHKQYELERFGQLISISEN